MQSNLNQLAAALLKDVTELLKELLKETKEMRATRERNRGLRRRLLFHPDSPRPATRAL
jgi:hypothetical protein